MLLRKVLLNRNLYRFAQTSVHAKKRALLECELAASAFEVNCWCLQSFKYYSSSHFHIKKRTRLELGTAKLYFSSQFSSNKEQLIKHGDQVPKEFSLIYKSSIDNYVVYSRRFSTIGFVFFLSIGIAKLYYLYPWTLETVSDHTDASDSWIRSDTEFLVYYISFIGFISALHKVVAMFPLRLYHNSETDEFIAIFSNIVGLPMKFNFTKGESKKLPPSGVLPWKHSYFSIKSKKVILFEHYFRLPADYNALLGLEDGDNDR